jgi:hypothetical protein
VQTDEERMKDIYWLVHTKGTRDHSTRTMYNYDCPGILSKWENDLKKWVLQKMTGIKDTKRCQASKGEWSMCYAESYEGAEHTKHTGMVNVEYLAELYIDATENNKCLALMMCFHDEEESCPLLQSKASLYLLREKWQLHSSSPTSSPTSVVNIFSAPSTQYSTVDSWEKWAKRRFNSGTRLVT